VDLRHRSAGTCVENPPADLAAKHRITRKRTCVASCRRRAHR
jgi:hypothetical protein